MHLSGVSREQKLLLPEAVEDYVAAEAPVRFIDAFVTTLDLVALGFKKAAAANTGRPPYDPGDLLRLYLYGYLYRLRSSRLLERECHKNLEVIWLLRTLKPDFKTIADFRKDNKTALQQTCRQFTVLCKNLNLFGAELIAVDGSKFKAVNSRDKNYNAKKLQELIARIDARIKTYLEELDDGDDQDPGGGGLSKEQLQQKIDQLKERKDDYTGLLSQLDEEEKQISTTDEEARLMHTRAGSDVCYNVQTAVDSKHKLIVEHEVTNDCVDFQQLAPMSIAAKKALGVETLNVVADKGYYSNTQVEQCVERGITPYIEKTDTSANTKLGLFGKNKFIFDTAKDVYRCPAGQELDFRFNTFENGRELRYYRAKECKTCLLRKQCTRNQGNRTITREQNEGLMEAMARRVKKNREIMKSRKAIVEHPFGTIKRWMNAGYFLCKGLEAVRTEMSLSVLVYNLKRVLNLVSFPDLLKALAPRS
jgi:transposase